MRALTLNRPMGAAIVHGTKRLENRPRDLPKAMRGRETIVAVHSGQDFSQHYAEAVLRIDAGLPYTTCNPGHDTPTAFDARGIVGLMRLSGRVLRGSPTVGFDTSDPWYSGPFAYEIIGAIALLRAVPCSGMLGWWGLPDVIVKEIAGQVPSYWMEGA